MLPTTTVKENEKAPVGWGPICLVNSALDKFSVVAGKLLDVIAPYPDEASVAHLRKRMAFQEEMLTDPSTGAQYGYYEHTK
mmetsp:Transcript_13307/g.17774  ORF Transcript_13307/g.17774 Transcript_13307/m.17774 type:complete len:81 (-) Transcript_13307:250-492(-)